ncbi:MAG: HNH endonuclease signature motif containing protein [Campylobacterota bacterium]|nr:HNH endonuclease signature motif containing protein [Campylobacterota bacterium]
MKTYTKIRYCKHCNKKETIRKDSKAETCKSCASKIRGAKGLKTIRKNTKWKKCKGCENKIQSYKKWDFCSRECSHKSKVSKRVCKHCNTNFTVLKSLLKTNASGNFCTRKCYEDWMCDTKRVKGRGSRWEKIRKVALKKAPFCAMCGTSKKLQVHHIIPYRLTRDNNQKNLIPLCVKHHKMIEMQTIDMINTNPCDLKTHQFVIRNMLKEYQLATAIKLKELYAERT